LTTRIVTSNNANNNKYEELTDLKAPIGKENQQ